jgi:hypothetical protein
MATQVSLTDGAVASAGALAIQTNGTTQAVSISTGQVATLAQNPILTSGTANGVAYLNGSKAVTSGSALTFDGTNLGLGVTPSAWALSGQKVLQVLNASLSAYTNDEATLSGNAYHYGSGWKYISSNYAEQYVMAGGAHKWYNAASGTAGNAITFTQAMTLDASGNLGIGVTSMNASLHVQGAATTDGALSFNQQLASTTAYNSSPLSGTMVALKYTSGGSLAGMGGWAIGKENSTDGNYSSYLGLYTRANGGAIGERARIDSSGNLLVGKTTTAANTGAGFVFNVGGAATATRSDSTNAATMWDTYSTGASAYRFYVGMGGTIYATSTTISAISDIRFKENVRDLNVGLAEVMALKPRLYDWKEGKGADIKNARGFIAQEFEQVFPDLIDEWKDPAPEGEEPYKSVRQDLIPVLVKAIQEQQALITSLTERISALEAK